MDTWLAIFSLEVKGDAYEAIVLLSSLELKLDTIDPISAGNILRYLGIAYIDSGNPEEGLVKLQHGKSVTPKNSSLHDQITKDIDKLIGDSNIS